MYGLRDLLLCIVGVKLMRVLSRRAGRSLASWSPCGETTPRDFDINNAHTIMIDPDYNMMLPNLLIDYLYSVYQMQHKAWI